MHPESLAEQFFRVDRGDCSHVRDIDIIIDLPEVISVARFHFTQGTGYEVIFSNACEIEDFQDAVAVVSRANIVSCEPYGWNASGYPQARALYWELRSAVR
ncbi:hypothetical protein GCM10029963_28900 [Micromonospora andamanensis]|nr:hypothetical protein Vwe01_18030 [Micromonospora andamanensis]